MSRAGHPTSDFPVVKGTVQYRLYRLREIVRLLQVEHGEILAGCRGCEALAATEALLAWEQRQRGYREKHRRKAAGRER